MFQRTALLAASFCLALGATALAQTPPAPVPAGPAASPAPTTTAKPAAKPAAATKKPAVPKTSTINVNLNNKGAMGDMTASLAYGEKRPAKAKAAGSVTASRHSAKAGSVTFKVKNLSKDTVHELLVVEVPKAGKPLPTKDDGSLDESKVTVAGEVSNLAAGTGGELTVTLKPGRYLLLCNTGKHYAAGMWTTFTVTK